MYGINKEKKPTEETFLSGYSNSQPVRVGNTACMLI